ncbi:hypothetical protein SUGI_0043920 [Cryptomeria japonica]|nr:hypothetical protein SUGI_0043920 [Cryptomeria japonica]
MGNALEILCEQAYEAKRYHLLGIHVQRAIFIHFCVCISLAIVWAYMGSILVAFGQDPLISFEARKFVRWLIPSLFAYVVLHKKILQTPKIYKIVAQKNPEIKIFP